MESNDRVLYADSFGIRMNSVPCNESNVHHDDDEHHAPYKLMFLFFVLFIGCLFKTVFASLRIPYTSLIIFIGFTGGILFNVFKNDDAFLTIITSSPDLLLAIFLPALIFESAYRTEYHAFMKSLYFILLLSMVGYLISLFGISVFNRYLFLVHNWTFLQCLTLGGILSATRPVTLMRQADYGRTKRLSIILEGESVINNSLTIILYNAIKNFVVDTQPWHTLSFFKTVSIATLGGIGLGIVAGVFEIISLPYFYDDPMSEITITVAVPYMLYWLCEQVHCSGVIAIVVLGLMLSNRKTAISSESSIFMEKFWDMLSLIANTIIYLLTAMTIAELIRPNVRTFFNSSAIFTEIGLAIVNYLICYIVRFMTMILLIMGTRLCRGSSLSWKECLLATWGGFRGSVCLILALALAGEFRLADNTRNDPFKNQILIHTSIVVFLSACINATYSCLLKVLDFTTMSQTKYLYMAQCVASLRDLVHEQMRILKNNKYLANADWIFIEKNFQIQNPHRTNNNQAKFNSIHRQTQCPECHQPGPMILDQTQYDDLFEEVRIRVINIQKTSFWRQYRDYEISSKAVRILSSLCDFALDKKEEFISVDQLKYYYKPRTFDFIWIYLGSLVRKVHMCTRDDWRKYRKVSRHKWPLFVFNLLNIERFNLFITITILINIILAMVRSAVVIMSNKINLILTIIQCVCTVVYMFEFSIKIYTFHIRVYFRTWIHYRIEFILLLPAIVECLFECSCLARSKRIPSLMHILFIIQLFRLVRIIEPTTGILNVVLERIANRYVTLSLELCKAYITSEDDVLSKLHRIIEIDRIRNDFHHDSIRRRDEIIDELTFIQSEHPNVSASVKTSAAIQKILNHSKHTIHHMTSKGLLGENEAHRITESKKMELGSNLFFVNAHLIFLANLQNINKRLHTELVPPALFFPIPLNFLHLFPWLHDPDVLEYVMSRLHVKAFSLNEYIYKVNSDAQALFFITAGYVETVTNTTDYHDALSIEKYHGKDKDSSLYDDRMYQLISSENTNASSFDPMHDRMQSIAKTDLLLINNRYPCQRCGANGQNIAVDNDELQRSNTLGDDLFQWPDDESERSHIRLAGIDSPLSFEGGILANLNMDDSILNFFPMKESTTFYRLLHAPGDIIGHIDLLNGQKYTETCKCITNTLVWHLKSNDLIDLIDRFRHLRILEKIWHYTALQVAEAVLYEYFDTLPYNANEQERIHIYGHLKRAFLIPESYLIDHKTIYSSHELILIQGASDRICDSQLRNITSSLIYNGPCFIQTEIGQCGLESLNVAQTKILVLRSPQHHTHYDEFVSANDLPDLWTHVVYDEKLAIFLPSTGTKFEHIGAQQSSVNESSSQLVKKTLLGRFLESLPKFQKRIMNS